MRFIAHCSLGLDPGRNGADSLSKARPPAKGNPRRVPLSILDCSPLSPVFGGEGGVRGFGSPPEFSPSPQPLSPEYRGEGLASPPPKSGGAPPRARAAGSTAPIEFGAWRQPSGARARIHRLTPCLESARDGNMVVLRGTIRVALVWLTALTTLVSGAPHLTCVCPNGHVKLFCLSAYPGFGAFCCGGSGQTTDESRHACCCARHDGHSSDAVQHRACCRPNQGRQGAALRGSTVPAVTRR